MGTGTGMGMGLPGGMRRGGGGFCPIKVNIRRNKIFILCGFFLAKFAGELNVEKTSFLLLLSLFFTRSSVIYSPPPP